MLTKNTIFIEVIKALLGIKIQSCSFFSLVYPHSSTHSGGDYRMGQGGGVAVQDSERKKVLNLEDQHINGIPFRR